MVKARKKDSIDDLRPFMAVGLVAEKVLVERDDVMTVVRIVDRVGIGSSARPVPNKAERLAIGLMMLIVIKSGGYVGKMTFSIKQVGPSEAEVDLTDPFDYTFDGIPDTGMNIAMELAIVWDGEGQYWFKMMLDGESYGRVPLHISLGEPLLIKKKGGQKKK